MSTETGEGWELRVIIRALEKREKSLVEQCTKALSSKDYPYIAGRLDELRDQLENIRLMIKEGVGNETTG